jgi:hypothetical protein
MVDPVTGVLMFSASLVGSIGVKVWDLGPPPVGASLDKAQKNLTEVIQCMADVPPDEKKDLMEQYTG